MNLSAAGLPAPDPETPLVMSEELQKLKTQLRSSAEAERQAAAEALAAFGSAAVPCLLETLRYDVEEVARRRRGRWRGSVP